MPYASDTEVPVERSKAQIEAMLRKHGATEYATGWSDLEDRIQFRIHNSSIRFVLPKVKRDEYVHSTTGRERSRESVDRFIAQADRQRWRALYLVILAKLEAVEAGIAVFEEEFLAFIVMKDGRTVGSALVPQIQAGGGGSLLQLQEKNQ